MFPKFYDDLHLELNDSLAGVLDDEQDPVKMLTAAMQEIGRTLDVLRTQALAVPFSLEMEVCFFKTIKPKFYALKIYHFELYGLLMNCPVGTKEYADRLL